MTSGLPGPPDDAATVPDDRGGEAVTAPVPPAGYGEAAGSFGRSLLRGLGWLAGGLTLVAGLTWLLIVELSARDVAIGAVLVAGSLVVLMPHRFRLPRRAAAVAVAAAALLGTFGGLAVKSAQEACMYCYVVYRGWPFTWATRGGAADDPATAKRLAEAANWDVNLVRGAVDLVLWGYLGLIGMTVAVLLHRRARGPVAGRAEG
jgi:hypothetical protein